METTHNSDLSYRITNNNLWISISMLLDKEDYDAHWAGENGCDGCETNKVLKIREILSPFSNEYGPDLQIWEEGNAFVDNLKPGLLTQIQNSLEIEFNEKFNLVERK